MNRIVAGYQIDGHSVRRQTAITKWDFFKTRLVFRLIVLGAFIVGLSLFYIWSRVQIVQTGYEINEIKKEQRQLLEENKKFQMELSLMKSPYRVKGLAEKQYDMVMPSQENIIEIN